MVTTRSNKSATPAQTHLEDFTKSAPQDSKEDATKATTTKKGKEVPTTEPAKKRKAVSSPSPEAKKSRTTPQAQKESTTSAPDIKKEDASSPPPKKAIAKTKSGQTKLKTENVSEGLASPAETAAYKKEASSPAPKNENNSSSKTVLKQEEDDAKNHDQEGEKEAEEEQKEQSDIIHINRSPVLDLWAACVTHYIHPRLSWETCLSAGSAVASLCAVSKGRSIGLIDPPTSDSTSTNGKSKTASDGIEEIEVMGFTLHIKDNLVVLGRDKKKGNEGLLKGKYGGEEAYMRVKGAFEEALQTWGDDREGLNGTAFAMYEDFRPSVAGGQKGWGKKGELSLDRVLETIAKG